MLRIGAHVDETDPLAEAAARNATAIQFFLADPQGWSAPRPHSQTAELLESDVDLYVHAPYVINVATLNNRVRMPSRKLLGQHAAAAAAIGAKGLIVHGGHVTQTDDVPVGIDNWRKAFESLWGSSPPPVPILIENTAGGTHAMARHVEAIDRLWAALDGYEVGFCLDTCHAHAGGEDLADIVDRVLAITGRVDLVHANGSKDAFGSGRDRHENLTAGQIDPNLIVAVIAQADAPVVCETPGGVDAQAADIALLRGALAP